MSQPIISIVLPVYNAEEYLEPCVKSILEQQEIMNFEVIAIDDGSTDRSFEILNDLGDERFLILRQRTNQKLIKALNIGIERSSAELVARMDADDIMSPTRLVKQLDFMTRNSMVAICGTYFDYIDGDGKVTAQAMQFPVQPEEVKLAFKTFTAVGHPTVMFRKSVLLEHTNLYSDRYPHAEDLGLWLECISKGLFLANFPEVLLHYRQHGEQVGSKHSKIQKKSTQLAYDDFGPLIWPDDYAKKPAKGGLTLKLRKSNGDV